MAPYGVYISADKKKGGKWQASIETAIENESESDARVKVVNTILDKKGKPVAVTTRDVDAKSGETTKIQQFLAIPENRVEPWDLNSPNLYGIRTDWGCSGPSPWMEKRWTPTATTSASAPWNSTRKRDSS